MFSLNRIELIGHIGQDPELRHTNTDQDVASMSLATNERWKDRSGKLQERTEWHRIICWNALALTAHKYLKAGSYVHVVGRLQCRTFDNKEGVKVRVWEVIAENIGFLDRRPKTEADVPDGASGNPDEPGGSPDDGPPPPF